MGAGFGRTRPAKEIRRASPRELLNEGAVPARATSSWMRSMPMKLT